MFNSPTCPCITLCASFSSNFVLVRVIYFFILNLYSYLILVDSGVSLRLQDRGPAAKKASRRREPRRHTVSNGIDYNMVLFCIYYSGFFFVI